MINPTYPGVYIEEVPSGVRPIAGVATSITAMVGRTRQGPVNFPVRIQSMGDYQRVFGELWRESPLSYAVMHFFQNGGIDAVIVRVTHALEDGDPGEDTTTATVTLRQDPDDAASAIWLELETATKDRLNPGTWGNRLSASVDHDTADPSVNTLFNLTIRLHEAVDPESRVVATETFRNISTDPASARFATSVLAEQSQYVHVTNTLDGDQAFDTDPDPTDDDPRLAMFTGGQDGEPLDGDDYLGTVDDKLGFFALEDADLFNLLYFPPMEPGVDVPVDTVLSPALAYCQDLRRAMLIVDAPGDWPDPASAVAGIGPDVRDLLGGANRGRNAMAYYPRLRMADPLQENRLDTFAPGGAMAGIIARTDVQRGVWKAPAGIEAGLGGVRELSYTLTDGENGQLNPLGLNCLRTKVPYGHIAWGARTLAGDDRFASEWKYIPIRRTALYIEESLFRGLHWVVFEPNDEPLWAQIRLNVKAFMQNLFKKGAFQGASPKEAYFVKCDRENNPQSQIDLGIVTVTVGFAPLKPAEFVIIQIQQMAGQIES